MATQSITVESDGFTVDMLIWRRYRRPMPGLLEQTLDINPGLAGLGPILPVGTVVLLPIVQTRDIVQSVEVISLWS